MATRGTEGNGRGAGMWIATGAGLLLIVSLVGFLAMRHPDAGPTDAAGTGMAMGGGYQRHPTTHAVPGTQMPGYADAAGISDVYAYAMANPKVLTYIPCTCGCDAMGHLSNWNCYIRAVSPDGLVTFEPHASGCQICVDITRDVMQMRARGTPLADIRRYIDANYGGQSTDTEFPPA